MKAIVYTKYGPPDVLQLKEVAKPIPKDNEVLIRVYAATVAAEDPMMRSFTFPLLFWLPLRIIFGLIKPRYLLSRHRQERSISPQREQSR